MRNRLILFLIWTAAIVALFSSSLSRLTRESLQHGYSSHIVLVPILAAYLIWLRRSEIFIAPSYGYLSAIQLIAFALFTAALAIVTKSQYQDTSSIFTVLSVIVLVTAGFVGLFGSAAFRKSIFPLGLLLLIVPIPTSLVEKIVVFLQSGSTSLSVWIFSILGVPVLRDGFVLSVPGVTIEVARECSGINSSEALVIVMILVAHEALQSTWRRALLILAVIPLSIAKNAIRIVTLTMLATRVDPGFLTGRLHHEGGFVFFLIALALLYPVLMLLKRTEARIATPEATRTSEIAALP